MQDYLGGGDKVQSIIRQFLGEDKVSLHPCDVLTPYLPPQRILQ